jgi:pyruvate formate lyase activating enzyme
MNFQKEKNTYLTKIIDMKIEGIQPFTLSDYPGHCAAIVFTAGCNYRCPFCHNKSLWTTHSDEAKYYQEEKNFFSLLMDRKKILDGVVITGGEPTIQPDLLDFIKKIRYFDYKIKLDTNGSCPQILEKLIKDRFIHYIAMDIKAPLPKYSALSGLDISTAAILKSIQLISKSKINHLFRTTWDKTQLSQNDLRTIKQLIPIKSKWVVQDCMI